MAHQRACGFGIKAVKEWSSPSWLREGGPGFSHCLPRCEARGKGVGGLEGCQRSASEEDKSACGRGKTTCGL